MKINSPLEAYKYLPKTNCGECGEPTCMAFASKLVLGTARLNQCILMKEEDAANYLSLETHLQLLGYETD